MSQEPRGANAKSWRSGEGGNEAGNAGCKNRGKARFVFPPTSHTTHVGLCPPPESRIYTHTYIHIYVHTHHFFPKIALGDYMLVQMSKQRRSGQSPAETGR